MSTYKNYYNNFISFFMVSAYRHNNLHKILKIQNVKIELFFHHYARLEDYRDFNYLSFVFLTTCFPTKITFKKVMNAKNGFFVFFIKPDRYFYDVFERFIFFSYAAVHNDPIQTEKNSNNYIRLTAKAWKNPETKLYRPGDWTTLNFFDFTQKFTLCFQLLPKKFNTLQEQRNFFRLLNVPYKNTD